MPVQTGFSEWSFWSVCIGTVVIPRHSNWFHQCFLNVENHYYLLILLYTNGSINQMLIKTLCSVWWWKRQSMLTVTILCSSLEVTGEWLKLARGHSPQFYRREHWQGCSLRCLQLLFSSGAIVLWSPIHTGSLMVDSGNRGKWDVKPENVQLNSSGLYRKPALCYATCHKAEIYRAILTLT